MRPLNSYILEKLIIDDTVQVRNVDTAVACITDICSISLDKKENNKMIDEIERWCKDNDVKELKDFICIANLSQIKKKSEPYYNNLKTKGWLKNIQDIPNNEDEEFRKEIKDKYDLVATSGMYKKLYVSPDEPPKVHKLVYVFDFIDAHFIFMH